MPRNYSAVAAPLTIGSGSDTKWVMTVTAPADQDIVLSSFVVSHNGTAADAAQIKYDMFRVTAVSSGTVLAPRGRDSRLDDDDINSVVRGNDVTATVSGAALDSRYIHTQSGGAFGSFVVPRGTSVGLRATQNSSTGSVAVIGVAVVQE